LSLQLSASERTLRARIAGYQRAALYDGREVTAKARERFHNGFVEKARLAAQAAGQKITEQEIERRGEALRRAHFAKLAFLAVKARSRTKKTTEARSLASVEQEASTSGRPTTV
jgi:hypothetical protein